MAAPKGNQYAVGNEGGRPPKYDLKKEAEDLLEWSSKPEAMTLYDFTDQKEYLAEDLSHFANRNEEFNQALKKAKERIGRNRERECSKATMNYGVWARSASLYDKMLKDHEKEIIEHKIDYEANKKAEMDKKNIASPNDAVINVLLDTVKSLKDVVDGSKQQTNSQLQSGE